jgi:hypothetical protein
MIETTSQEDASLLDVLIDCFEKNEVPDGNHWRSLPMPTEEAAVRKFGQLAEEARRWKGTPTRQEESAARRVAAWPDLDIRQAGRGILVRVRAPWFHWWHEGATWGGDPMGAIRAWLGEEDRRTRR